MNDKRHSTREVPTDFPWKLIEYITNDFAPERKIGSGGYGVVYKGLLDPNGQEVAVKKLYHMPALDEDQFQNELQILTGICHPNIVQFVGKSYIERDGYVEHQGRLLFTTMIDRAICLEFLPKGSLEKHLSDNRSELRWHSCYKIIKGICDGLKYLHGERIFHLDLNPSNILLDKDMVPKIADFGLSRLFNGTCQSHTTKNRLNTLGYAPPEFVDKGEITNKFDVFSLGVIIIKVLAGRDGYSTYSDMSDSQDFTDLVLGNWREKLVDIGWKDFSYLDAYCNQIKTCTEIALKCVETISQKRPDIEDIISMLNETEETIDKLYQQLFVVEPPHLCFPFEPDKLIPCPVHLTNNADHDIAYRIRPPNTPDVFVSFLNGIVPARSTQTYVLTMQKQEKPPPNLDTIHIQSAVANMKFITLKRHKPGHNDSMFDNAEVVHDERKVVKITSLYEGASQLASKPRIEVLLPHRSYAIDVHPLKPWVLITPYDTEIWNYKTGVELDLSDMLKATVAKFIARNQWIVAGDEEGYVDVYCYKTMQRLKRFEAYQDQPIIELAVHPTEPYVLSASCSNEGNVKLWDWEKGWECNRIFDIGNVNQLTFLNMKDTCTFAVWGGDDRIKIYSLGSPGSAEFILSEYIDPGITCFDYYANGDQQHLITGNDNGTVKIWDMHRQNLVETVEGVHHDSVEAICCHSECEHLVLVTGSEDGTVCLWNPTTLRPERRFNFGLGDVRDVKICMASSRSYRVVTAHMNGLAMIEMDRNDPVVANTGSSSKVENDLVGSRKRKLSESELDRVPDTGNVAQQMQGNGPTDEEAMELNILEHVVAGSEEPSHLDLSLLQSITENFSEQRKIGVGGCGEVYKGILQNGTVAVKRLFNSRTIKDKMFHREIQSLITVRHENIVRFLGYCSFTEEHVFILKGRTIMADIRERLLCFVYISNGNLENHLTDELRGLEWHTRYEIILGICKGLLYLHKEKDIIHMDLKPANILLDDHMVPKITDFGLSRFDNNSHTKTASRFISLGYCAPEYLSEGKSSSKSDIYSLGVMITELVTGTKNEPDLSKVLRRWRHRWIKSSKHTSFDYRQVTTCLVLAQRSMQIDPTDRPDILYIMSELNAINTMNDKFQVIPLLEDMLGIEPLEIGFPFELDAQIAHSIELTNDTDGHIAFMIEARSRRFHIEPDKGIVPPRFKKCSVTVTMQAHINALANNHYKEEITVLSTRVDGGLAAVDITGDLFIEKEGTVVDEVNVMVVFDKPPSVDEES